MAKRRAKGEGSIFKEGATGYWCAEISVPTLDGASKKIRKRSKSQQVVKDWLLEQRNSIRIGRLQPNKEILFGDFLDYFIQNVATPTLKPKTVESYRWLADSHIKPNLGHIPINELKPADIQELYKIKLDEKLSKRTVQHMHAVIRRSLNIALKWELIHYNPTASVTAPTPDRKPPKTFTVEQARTFLKTVENHRWYPIYILAITTGMRMGEILGLHWEDVDLEKRTLSIQHTVQMLRGRIIMGEPKTPKSRRTIALTDYALNILKPLQSEGLVFQTKNGTPVHPRNLSRHFYESLKKAGLPRMRFHDLRHTAATLLLKENVHPKVVQEMLGHSSIMLTLDTYSHILPDMQKQATKKMDKLFDV